VTAFEQLSYAKHAHQRPAFGTLRPPSRSAKVAAKRASFYGQIQQKATAHVLHGEPKGSSVLELNDLNNRLRKLEDDISDLKDLVRELLRR